MGERNFSRTQETPSLRGNIFDYKGNLLATNEPITNIDWQGTGSQTLTKSQSQTLEIIEQTLLKYNQPAMTSIGKIKRAEKFSTITRLASDISFEALSEISEQCAESKNIVTSTNFKRFYPHKSLACHTLGYLGDIDMQYTGKMGLERIFEEVLKGKNGTMSNVINSFGKRLQQQAIMQSESGQNIVTTLDIDLQKIAETHMPNDLAGSLILLDPKTGALRALVSKPGFDPTIFLKPLSNEQWQQLQIDRPFINRAFNACYPPASIFKLVTISAALEEGIIEPETVFDCKGFVTFKKRKYFCNRRWGHGPLNIKEGLAHSCNIACYEIAKKISIDTLADYAFRFGLGEKTDIIFPEKQGIVPSNDWKLLTKGERWWQGETLSASIGQSFLLTTPIQTACMIGSIFQGNLVRPRILESSEIYKTPLHLKESTLEFLQSCMESVVTTGTGRNINRLKNITVFAKTGTAQTSNRALKNTEKKHRAHAWFVSYFYYQEQEPLVLVILIEHAGGSRIATTVAKKFLADYMKTA